MDVVYKVLTHSLTHSPTHSLTHSLKDVDTDVVAAALTALLDLQENWITNDLYVHRYSIGILDVVRRNVLAGNWLTVYDSLYVLFNIPEGVGE